MRGKNKIYLRMLSLEALTSGRWSFLFVWPTYSLDGAVLSFVFSRFSSNFLPYLQVNPLSTFYTLTPNVSSATTTKSMPLDFIFNILCDFWMWLGRLKLQLVP